MLRDFSATNRRRLGLGVLEPTEDPKDAAMRRMRTAALFLVVAVLFQGIVLAWLVVTR